MQSIRVYLRLILGQLALTGIVGVLIAIAVSINSAGTWLRSITGDAFLENSFQLAGASLAIIGVTIYLTGSAAHAIQTFRSFDSWLQRRNN
jgi:hypothetical protein